MRHSADRYKQLTESPPVCWHFAAGAGRGLLGSECNRGRAMSRANQPEVRYQMHLRLAVSGAHHTTKDVIQ